MLFYISANSLLKGSWILTSTSASNSVRYITLDEVHEKNQFSHNYVVRKGKNILIVFTDNCG